jgi:hypothetical protein
MLLRMIPKEPPMVKEKCRKEMSVQYFKCLGFDRVRMANPNFFNAKVKALNASMSYESEFDNFKEKNMSYMDFIASVNDLNGPSEIELSILDETL